MLLIFKKNILLYKNKGIQSLYERVEQIENSEILTKAFFISIENYFKAFVIGKNIKPNVKK